MVQAFITSLRVGGRCYLFRIVAIGRLGCNVLPIQQASTNRATPPLERFPFNLWRPYDGYTISLDWNVIWRKLYFWGVWYWCTESIYSAAEHYSAKDRQPRPNKEALLLDSLKLLPCLLFSSPGRYCLALFAKGMLDFSPSQC